MNHSYFLKILLVLVLIKSSNVFAFQSTNILNKESSLDQFVSGIDYQVIQSQSMDMLDELDQLQKVVDIEVFYWYGCSSCQQFELALSEYLKSHPDIEVKRTPLVAHIKWREQAYIQPILFQLQALLPDTELPSSEALYQACIADCSVFDSYEKILLWMQQNLQLAELPRLDEASIWQVEKDLRKRADYYSISQVPTIIIRESHSVDANSAKSLTRLINIVDHLLVDVTKP